MMHVLCHVLRQYGSYSYLVSSYANVYWSLYQRRFVEGPEVSCSAQRQVRLTSIT
jgi:hypothetical protein